MYMIATAPRMLRLGFHDCFLGKNPGEGGCDGCLDWTDKGFRSTRVKNGKGGNPYATPPTANRPHGELGHNVGLEETVDFLEQVYVQVFGRPRSGTNRVSRADLWAFASMTAVEYGMWLQNRTCDNGNGIDQSSRTGGCLHMIDEPDCKISVRKFRFKSGRRDCRYDRKSHTALWKDRGADDAATGPELLSWMAENFGMNGRETAALNGAHTYGQFNQIISGYMYGWVSRNVHLFNNDYYRALTNKKDWMYDDDDCVPMGRWNKEKPEGEWALRAFIGRPDRGPFQWIRHQLVAWPNCKARPLIGGSGQPASSCTDPKMNKWRPHSCAPACQNPTWDPNTANGTQEKERWMFIWVHDECMMNSDMGLYYNFTRDPSTGRATGVPILDEWDATNWSASEWGSKPVPEDRNAFTQLGKQTHEIDDGVNGKRPIYEILDEYANSQQAWIQDFVPAMEKMLENGYGSTDLTYNFDVNIPNNLLRAR